LIHFSFPAKVAIAQQFVVGYVTSKQSV